MTRSLRNILFMIAGGIVAVSLIFMATAEPSMSFTAKSEGERVELVVKNISILEPLSGTFVPHQDIIVRGTRIAEVRPASEKLPPSKVVIDGTGKFVIPGLFDNHVHIARLTKESAALFLTFGVTSVRDMGSDPEKINAWRKQIDYGKFYGPRIVQASGPMLEGRGEQRVDHWLVANPVEARAVVEKIANLGMDCIKVRTVTNLETYLAIAQAAQERGLPLYGHGLDILSPKEALEAGQKSFEHAFYPYPFSKTSADEKNALFAAFKSTGAVHVPTLAAWQPATQSITALREKAATYEDSDEFKLPEELLDHWKKSLVAHEKEGRGSEGWQKAIRTAAEDIGEMHRNGVAVLPGTDTGAPFVVPGAGLHEEFALLTRMSGLTPAEVLRAATINSAEFYGKERDLGSIESGKIADFVVLDKNPLERIENSTSIDAVIFRGEVLSRAHLNIMLSQTKTPMDE